MPCDSDQMCKAIIKAGGRFPCGAVATTASQAPPQNRKGPVACLVKVPVLGHGHAGLEHGREVGRLLARKAQVGVTQALERGQWAWAAVIPGGNEALSEALEALARHVRHQGVAIAEMSVWRCRAHTGLPGRLSKREAGGTLLRNEIERGAD